MSLLTVTDALEHLTDALGPNYGGTVDEDALNRALGVDSLTVARPVDSVTSVTTLYLRPWATAARLIRFNTEYEVGGELTARLDRKINALLLLQRGEDMANGILELILAREASLVGTAISGVLRTVGVF